MSGETEKEISGWTVDTLKEFAAHRFSAQTDLYNEKIARAEEKIGHVEELLTLTQSAAKEAISKSEEATRIHFASVNEFNVRMKEVVQAQASREWAEGYEKTIDAKFQAVNASIKALELMNIQKQGQSEGLKMSAGFLVAALSAAVTIISIVVFVSRFVG